MNNVFYNNHAIYGGGGIYFKNKILKFSPYQLNNTFKENKALFANDFYTFPIKVLFQDNRNFKSWVKNSNYVMNITPGITQINLNFSVVDYYGQTLKTMNRYFFLYKIFKILNYQVFLQSN